MPANTFELGRWRLDIANESVEHSDKWAAGWWLDLRSLRSAWDALDLLRAASDKPFVNIKDVVDLAEVLRTYLKRKYGRR